MSPWFLTVCPFPDPLGFISKFCRLIVVAWRSKGAQEPHSAASARRSRAALSLPDAHPCPAHRALGQGGGLPVQTRGWIRQRRKGSKLHMILWVRSAKRCPGTAENLVCHPRELGYPGCQDQARHLQGNSRRHAKTVGLYLSKRGILSLSFSRLCLTCYLFFALFLTPLVSHSFRHICTDSCIAFLLLHDTGWDGSILLSSFCSLHCVSVRVRNTYFKHIIF